MVRSIMIIDDNREDRYILKRLIKKIRFTDTIFEFSNGKEALDFLLNYDCNFKKYPSSFPPMLIFLDINMPIMDGFEFLDHFKKIQYSEHELNIITMFTSSGRETEKSKALTYGFVKGFIIKMPDTPKKLLETIGQFCPHIPL